MPGFLLRSEPLNPAPPPEAARRLVSRQEFERARLGSSLHDRTIGDLAALSIRLHGLQARLPESMAAALAEEFAALRTLIDAAARDVRGIAGELRPVLLDRVGLGRAIEDYAQRFSRDSGIRVTVTRTTLRRLGADQESALFRILQEALANCAQHAHASQVHIGYHSPAGRILLEVRDDGLGFQPDSLFGPASRPGSGILAMKERAEFAGGVFSLESRPGKGTCVRVTLRLPPPHRPRADANAGLPPDVPA